MKSYTVKSRVEFGKADDAGKVIQKAKTYEAGSTIEMDDDDAAPLLNGGAIEAAPEKASARKEK